MTILRDLIKVEVHTQRQFKATLTFCAGPGLCTLKEFYCLQIDREVASVKS